MTFLPWVSSTGVTAEGTQYEIVLKALEPETQYSVIVEATALTGRSKSNERIFRTKKIGENDLITREMCQVTMDHLAHDNTPNTEQSTAIISSSQRCS